MISIHIGVDDVDSIHGGCTTHFAAKLAFELKKRGFSFIDYLNLVRLNPAVPFKTRGNGAVALRLAVESESEYYVVWELAKHMLNEYISELKDPKHQPVIAVFRGSVGERVQKLAVKAMSDIVTLDLALKAVEKEGVEFYSPKSELRGLIGALAAIGYTMQNTDYTFELIAYRVREYWGKPRLVDAESVIRVDKVFKDKLLLNYDYESNRVLITPRGPDPVLLGLRGEEPGVLIEAFKLLVIHEPVEYIAIYRTNQHTDSHLKRLNSICDAHPYMCVSVVGVVKTKPERLRGGHVFFELCDSACCITVAAYEPTKSFRDVVEKLEPGDLIEACGCIRPPGPGHGPTLNLEKLRVIELARVFRYENPRCPVCGARMESAGRDKGYRCKKCSFRDPNARKVAVPVRREIKPGWYQPPYSAFKHLMKPIERFGREKKFFNGQVEYDVVVKLA